MLLFFSLALFSCAQVSLVHETDPAQLRHEIAQDVPHLSAQEVVIPHEISPALKADLDELLPQLENRSESGRALVSLLFGKENLALQYAWAETRTAEETIQVGRGNCLSLAAVVVGTARAYGGAARYIEIQDKLERRKEGDLGIWAGHIAVFLPNPGSPLVVDFTGAQRAELSSFRVLEDRDLVAHFYNDQGYDLVREAQEQGVKPPRERVKRYFEIATSIDPEFNEAWNNLGVALARLGEWKAAEDAYENAMIHRRLLRDSATPRNQASLAARKENAGHKGIFGISPSSTATISRKTQAPGASSPNLPVQVASEPIAKTASGSPGDDSTLEPVAGSAPASPRHSRHDPPPQPPPLDSPNH